MNETISITPPPGLEYLPYQLTGITRAMGKPRTLIGDQMGLGKTVQALGVIAHTSAYPALIVVPASLKLNWARESMKWAPGSKPVLLAKRPKPAVRRELRSVFQTGEITSGTKQFVTTPGTSHPAEAITSDKLVLILNYDVLEAWEFLIKTIPFRIAAFDEFHFVKNPKAKRTRAARRIAKNIPRVLGLTGTPIMNRPVDLLSQLDVLGVTEQLFGDRSYFLDRYCNRHVNSYGVYDVSGATNLGELQQRLSSTIMIRRQKKDVLKDLPPKRRQLVELEVPTKALQKLIAQQLTSYEQQKARVEKYRNEVLQAKRSGTDEQYEAAAKLLREAESIAFEDLSRVRAEIAMQKLPFVIDYIKTALESEDKLIVFAHHKDVIKGLQAAFPASSVVIDGSTPAEARMDAVDAFQNNPGTKLFIGNIIAAGTGITLTAASHVIFAELDWVPANMTQAEDRAHRIGQTNSVLITHLVLDGSLDARMARTLIRKQSITNKALDAPNRIQVTRAPNGQANLITLKASTPLGALHQSTRVFKPALEKALEQQHEGIRTQLNSIYVQAMRNAPVHLYCPCPNAHCTMPEVVRDLVLSKIPH